MEEKSRPTKLNMITMCIMISPLSCESVMIEEYFEMKGKKVLKMVIA